MDRPYYRTARQFTDGRYQEGGRWQYVCHPQYAQSPAHYIRPFLLIQKDLQELFDYIEPADQNLVCFSFRIHELLLRACVEIEANFKAILSENGYTSARWLKITDYKRLIGTSHFLSDYQVKLPFWRGDQNIRQPFEAWASDEALTWYNAYNSSKHNRHEAFTEANLANLLDAVSGLVIVLSAQFLTEDFSPGLRSIALEGPNDGMESAIGGYFRVKFPTEIPADSRNDFDWQQLRTEVTPFQHFNYKAIKLK